MIHPCQRLVLIILCLVGHTVACPDLTVTRRCTCNPASGEPFRFRLSCNSVSIENITEAARSESAAGNITSLLFVGSPDEVLRAAAFEGFTSAHTLTIQFSGLSYIEPRTFSTLPQLSTLDLRSNMHLTWLSVDPFLGLTSLSTLKLEGSQIRHLRDNLEPFFSSITNEIALDDLPLQCDCHILWLYDFTTTHSTVQGAECDGEILGSLNRSASFNECIDLCTLGFHPCDGNATCQWEEVSDQVTCSCFEGFTGSGVECQPLQCECDGDNMVCGSAVDTGSCVCAEGYTLSEAGVCVLQTTQCSQFVNGAVMSVTVVGDECVSQEVKDLVEQVSSLTLADAELAQFTEQFSTTAANVTLADSIPQLVAVLETVVTLIEDGDVTPSFNVTGALVEVASHLLDGANQQLWQNISTSDPASDVVTIFSTLNELGTVILTRTNFTNFTSDNIALVVVRPDCEDEESVPSFGGQNISSDLLGKPPEAGASNLSLPATLFEDVFSNKTTGSCSEVGVVSLVYGGVGPLLSLDEELLLASLGCSENGTRLEEEEEEVCSWYGDEEEVECPIEWLVNSVIISASVVNSSEVVTGNLTTPVVITLRHADTSLSNPVCSFINEMESLDSGDSWLTNGCERDAEVSTSTVTVCQCYHLTSFALLMSPTSSSPSDNRPLHIATKVGLSLSITCLFITILLLYTLKLENKMLHRVHRQLATALGLAQLVFLVGVDRSAVPSPDQLCTAWAALLHYLLLVTFLWQLCEGVHLYLYLGKVFANYRKWEAAYYFLAWGLPLLIVGPTLGLRFCDYGSEDYCWITTGRGTNWAFHGPVIAVLAVNIVVLVYVTFIIVRATRRKEGDACLFFTLLHASFVLVPILGVSWVLGFLVVGEGIYTTIIEWFFFFFTTLQGAAIFITHCVLNREVRTAFLKAIGCRKLAKKQKTVMSHSRQISRVGSTVSSRSTNLFRKIMSRREKHSFARSESSFMVGGFTNAGFLGGDAQPSSAYALSELARIEEEGSLSSSAPTPQTVPRTSV